LRILGIGPGDAVLTVSHTAVATVAAIELAGARPVLVDVDPVSYTMDVGQLQEIVEQWRSKPDLFGGAVPKAVIPVHLYGHPADMAAILRVARANRLAVVEDCAQAHGAVLDGRPVGTWGDLAAFSFYPTKNLGAIGDGGAVVCNSEEHAHKGRLLRQYGWEHKSSMIPGMNSRLDEIQAAILRQKLPALAAENHRRREIAATYTDALGDVVATPRLRAGSKVSHVYHQYVIRHAQRDALRRFMRDERQVLTMIHYPEAVHQQAAYADRNLTAGRRLAVTEGLCKEILSLPIYPELSHAHIDRVCRAIRDFCG